MRTIKYLIWDSRFFGLKIGKIVKPIGAVSQLNPVLQEANQKAYRCLYFENQSNRPALHSFLKRRFFSAGSKVILEAQLSRKFNFASDKSIYGVKGRKLHLNNCIKISESEICKKSRFYNDPKFGPSVCKKLYRLWIKKSVLSGYCRAVLGYKIGNRIVGLVTLRKKGKDLYIDLFGISKKFQGRGIGRSLLGAAKAEAVQLGVEKLRVVTQGTNMGAVLAYQKSGFKIISQTPVYHLWLSGK